MSFPRKREASPYRTIPRLREGKLWTPAYAGVT